MKVWIVFALTDDILGVYSSEDIANRNKSYDCLVGRIDGEVVDFEVDPHLNLPVQDVDYHGSF